MKTATKIPLDAALKKRLDRVISDVWNAIGSDIEACSESCGEMLTNEQAVESCIDADHLVIHGNDPEAQLLIRLVFEQHGYQVTLAWLSKNFRLA